MSSGKPLDRGFPDAAQAEAGRQRTSQCPSECPCASSSRLGSTAGRSPPCRRTAEKSRQCERPPASAGGPRTANGSSGTRRHALPHDGGPPDRWCRRCSGGRVRRSPRRSGHGAVPGRSGCRARLHPAAQVRQFADGRRRGGLRPFQPRRQLSRIRASRIICAAASRCQAGTVGSGAVDWPPLPFPR
jgi:hypothetical protein